MITESVSYNPVPFNSFLMFSLTAQKIADTRITSEKIDIFLKYFDSLNNNEETELAARFLSDGAFPKISGKRIKIGSRNLGLYTSGFCDINYDLVFKPSKKATGDLSETIQKLMENVPEAQDRRIPAPISLREIDQIYIDLESAKSKEDRKAILFRVWEKMTGLEIKYFLRIMLGKKLQIDFDKHVLLKSLSSFYHQDFEEMRHSYIITGDFGKTVVLAKNDSLEKASYNIFYPLPFMLGTKTNSLSQPLIHYIAEENFDGLRCQVHIQQSKIRIFSRKLKDITHFFPEVVTRFKKNIRTNAVLDGMLCVFFDDKIQSFHYIGKRLSVGQTLLENMEKYPVIFISFDILYYGNETTFHLPLLKRRKLLEQMAENNKIAISRQFHVDNNEQLKALIQGSVQHGNRGLLLKEKDSDYKCGKRQRTWIKFMQTRYSLKTVIMYVQKENIGNTGNKYCFTLGIRVDNDKRYTDNFIPIGKVCNKLSDNDMELFTKQISDLVISHYGPILALKPEIVTEVEFDKIGINKRTKANFVLLSPHIHKICWDLNKDHTHTLKDVENLYQARITEPRKKQGSDPSFIYPN